jgi:hypothetical protein
MRDHHCNLCRSLQHVSACDLSKRAVQLRFESNFWGGREMGHWYRDTPKQFTLSCFSASSLSHADLLHCKGGVDVLSIPMIYTPFLSFFLSFAIHIIICNYMMPHIGIKTVLCYSTLFIFYHANLWCNVYIANNKYLWFDIGTYMFESSARGKNLVLGHFARWLHICSAIIIIRTTYYLSILVY